MNLRLACSWVREQMIDRAHHRLVVGPDQAAKEDVLYEAAVAEVDDLLDPQEAPQLSEGELLDVWAAAGAEIAGVS